ncbi:ABC transporter substrate-binding protein [Kribbella sp. NPDC049174]|uniref:ABC transporter substrate-binding protein n=1 Tax=Kribbella sp. NPDC049174 TaxID=3364112 RepID=UPI003723EC23
MAQQVGETCPVASWDEAPYDGLPAPSSPLNGLGKDTWQEAHLPVGKALGRTGRAGELVTEVEGKIADARKANSVFAGKTVTFFNYAGAVLYLIHSNEDTSIKFLRALGFAGVSDTVAAMPNMQGSSGRAEVSPELYSKIEADLIIGTSSDGKLDTLTATPPSPASPP